MLKLKRMRARNWNSISDAEIEFPDKGLVVVTGKNSTHSNSLESIGTGKTTLGELLTRSVIGCSGRYNNISDFSKNRKGDTYVLIESTLGSKNLKIEYGYKCKELSRSSEGLKFTLDSEPIQRGHLRDTRQELTHILGVSPEFGEWGVFIDGDTMKFNKMSQEQSVSLLLEALNIDCSPHREKIRIILDKISSKVNDMTSSITQLSLTVEKLKDRIQGHKVSKDNLIAEKTHILEKQQENSKKLEEDIAESNKHINLTKKLVADLEEEIKKTEENYKEKTKIEEANIRKMTDEVAILRNKFFTEKDKFISIRNKKSNLEIRIKDLRNTPTKCKECGSTVIDQDHINKKINELISELVEVTGSYDSTKQVVELTKHNLLEKESKLQNLTKDSESFRLTKHISSLREEHIRHTSSIDKEKSHLVCLEKERIKSVRITEDIDSKISLAKNTILECSSILSEDEYNLIQLKEQLVEESAFMSAVKYWHTAFNARGINNLIVEQAIDPLNSISRTISKSLSGGNIEVTYSASKTLVTGKEKSELHVSVNNAGGCNNLSGSSKGESGLTNLIISETLSTIGMIPRKIGYQWYDEILVSKPSSVRHKILSYLKEKARANNMLIFITDHNEETINYADYHLLADKNERGTTYRYAN